MHVATGLLEGVRQVCSPHQDARPDGIAADLIVMHGISLPPGEFGGPWIEQLFNGQRLPDFHPYFATVQGMRVSAHLLVRRDGEIVQFVPFHRRAWHAGASRFEGRTACNDFSIGIEMEGADASPYEAAQYHAAAVAIRALLHAYPTLAASRLVGHSDIAPGRKTDPGESFDWAALREALA
ncbi:MAG: 1,6-anhydro-N-acetylmuramyl-L-alanine amidase AmpD [Steroidobacteraceae bacterium]